MPRIRTCLWCKTDFPVIRGTRKKCCSKACGQHLRQRTAGAGGTEPRTCPWCKTEFTERTSSPVRFCTRSCAAKNRNTDPKFRAALYSNETRAKISAALKGVPQEHSSRRMLTNNPMASPEVVAKMIATKRRNGTLRIGPRIRGGNGTHTKEQLRLHEALQDDWELELSITTGLESPYPPAYKVDIGHRLHQVAIEVDGKNHRSRKSIAVDAKKTQVLESLGWRVIRFTNQDVNTRLSWVLSELTTFVEAG